MMTSSTLLAHYGLTFLNRTVTKGPVSVIRSGEQGLVFIPTELEVISEKYWTGVWGVKIRRDRAGYKKMSRDNG